jgi:hypothetical protein
MAYSGRYTPQNPSKYKGDPSNIWYRSLWERKAMVWFDCNENVIQWSSEEFFIPYLSPMDNKYHRYFPDFLIKVRRRDGEVQTILVEVKPEKQTKPPEKKKKVTKGYLTEIATWGINEAKWKAAREFCADRKWEFKVVTEKELFKKPNK